MTIDWNQPLKSRQFYRMITQADGTRKEVPYFAHPTILARGLRQVGRRDTTVIVLWKSDPRPDGKRPQDYLGEYWEKTGVGRTRRDWPNVENDLTAEFRSLPATVEEMSKSLLSGGSRIYDLVEKFAATGSALL